MASVTKNNKKALVKDSQQQEKHTTNQQQAAITCQVEHRKVSRSEALIKEQVALLGESVEKDQLHGYPKQPYE